MSDHISEMLANLSGQIRLKERAANDALLAAASRVADIFHNRRERMDKAMTNLAHAQEQLTNALRAVSDATVLVRSIETEAESEATAIGSDLMKLRQHFTPREVAVTTTDDVAGRLQQQVGRLQGRDGKPSFRVVEGEDDGSEAQA